LDATSAEDLTIVELEKLQKKSPLFLLNLMQVLEPMANQYKPKIWCITRGVQNVNEQDSASSFAMATLWGMLSVIGYQEHTEYFGGLIDMDPAKPSDEAEMLFDDLVGTFNTDLTAYRNGSRYMPLMIEAPEVYSDLPEVQFKSNGSYLITGGLGGLGTLVARWMAENCAGQLILMGRTKLPPRSEWNSLSKEDPSFQKVKEILKLEAMGGHIHIASVDVGNEQQLSGYLDNYKKENWPPIRGLFHAAGIS
jgi:hypothetical protein